MSDRAKKKTKTGQKKRIYMGSFGHQSKGQNDMSDFSVDGDGDTQPNRRTLEFFRAVHIQDHQRVEEIIKEKRVDINSKEVTDNLQPSALLIACELNDIVLAKLLIHAKPKPADVNVENHRGRRALWWAVKHRNKELVELLLYSKDEKCEVNELDKETGCSPLYTAILRQSADIVEALIRAGADVNQRRVHPEFGTESPLIKAVQLDCPAISELLINSLCKIQAKTDCGLTALHFAVGYCRYKISEILLENGAKIHAKTNAGWTPMTIAIQMSNPAMCRLLLQHGYKMDKKYSWTETPLEQAIKIFSEECAMTIVHWGCSLARSKGPSYFYMAVHENLMKLAKFLVAVQPQFLGEDWIQEQEWPVSTYFRPDIRHWILERARQPHTLKQLCRAKVFRQLGKYNDKKIDKLLVPDDLKHYLKYKEYVKDKFYKKNKLDLDDCPLDCRACCKNQLCPPIDLSDSDYSSETDG